MSETTFAPGNHKAVHARFQAYRLGLLNAATTQELREHLRACASCLAAFEPFGELSSEEEERPGHVPLALLVLDDGRLAALPGAERALIEEHVTRCERCAGSRAFAARMRAAGPPRQSRSRLRWRLGFGAAAGAAVVAALALGVLRDRPTGRIRGDESPPPGRRTASASPSPPEAPSARTFHQIAPPPNPARPSVPIVQLGGTVRSGGGQVVRVPVGTAKLSLRVPPLLGVGPTARVRIDVTGPGGAALGHAALAHRALFGEHAPPAIEARAPEGSALRPGPYAVHVMSDEPDPALPGAFEQAEYGFRLELGPDPGATP